MTRIVVFTDDDSYRTSFAALERSRTYAVEFYPKDELRSVVRDLTEPTVLYYDLEGESQHARSRNIRYLTRGPEHPIGVIDGAETVPDPAELFHAGAVDYLGPNALEQGVQPKRVRRALSLFEHAYGQNGSAGVGNARVDDEADQLCDDATTGGSSATMVLSPQTGQRMARCRPSGLDWSRIQASQDYTFLMLYAELDLDSDLRRIWSTRRIESLSASFRNYLETELADHQARTWMWHDTAGLLLLPFDGQHCLVLRDCVRLMLSQTLMAVEHLDLSHAVGFRLALTTGETTYQNSGQTGGIISDSVNFVFHLGKKYLRLGQFIVGEEVLWLADPRLRKLFTFDKRYENRELHRMYHVL